MASRIETGFLPLEQAGKNAIGASNKVLRARDIEVQTEPVQPPNGDPQSQDASIHDRNEPVSNLAITGERVTERVKPKIKYWTPKKLMGAAVAAALMTGAAIAGGVALGRSTSSTPSQDPAPLASTRVFSTTTTGLSSLAPAVPERVDSITQTSPPSSHIREWSDDFTGPPWDMIGHRTDGLDLEGIEPAWVTDWDNISLTSLTDPNFDTRRLAEQSPTYRHLSQSRERIASNNTG